MTIAAPPMPATCGSNCSICDLSSTPASSAAPTHSAPPSVLKAEKRAKRMPTAPASGGAIIARPGTNLAKIRAFAPQRSKLVWV